MRKFLDSSKCSQFSPSFDNKECEYYAYAENDKMEIKDGECGYCKRPECYRCVADITRNIPLSHSSIGDFLTCHYLYYLKKILGIEKRPAYMSDALKAGKLWDTVKQKHLGAKVNIQKVINEYEINPIVVAKVRALFHAYKELEITVEPGYELQAKIDLTYEIKIAPNTFIPSYQVGQETIRNWQEGKLWRDNWEEWREWKESGNKQFSEWTFPLNITGFYDRKYPTYFCEDKLSSKPDFYLDPYHLQSQCGTYFLADPNLEYVIMEVVRFPQDNYNKRKEEIPEEVYKKTYDAVLSKPSTYFLGYNREKKMYGKKFYRGEFDLESIKQRYQQVVIEIMAARWNGNFYKNDRVCSNILPGIICEYQSVCRNQNVSDEIYKIRSK